MVELLNRFHGANLPSVSPMLRKTRKHVAPVSVAGYGVVAFAAALIVLCACVVHVPFAAAQSAAGAQVGEDKWRAQLASHDHGPAFFLAVDKKKQRLYVMEQRSPLSATKQFFCSTGEVPGDKQYEGDLRTPEGVYFVQRRLEGGLDYALYGDLAFTLDYPNPVDRIKGKTGSGIWIHGRGHKPTVRETKGCMALDTPDVHLLDGKVGPGSPVLIAGDVQWTNKRYDSDVPDKLVGKVLGWADAWESKSEDYFRFYDHDRYAKGAGRPFDAFRDYKENLFRNLPWISVMVSDVRVLPGPDYWVTWFGQLYRSSTLVSEGMKRLYWMPDENGELRIVAEAWESYDLGLEEQYLQLVGGRTLTFIESWRNAWEAADLEGYLRFYDSDADQGGRRGRSAIKDHKSRLWDEKEPLMVGIDDLDISLHQNGVKVSFIQEYKAKGFSDKGVKTLYLQPQGESWKIVSENWSAL